MSSCNDLKFPRSTRLYKLSFKLLFFFFNFRQKITSLISVKNSAICSKSDLLIESLERIRLYIGDLVLVKAEDFKCVKTFESPAVNDGDFVMVQIQNQEMVEVSQRDRWDATQRILGEIQLCQSGSCKVVNYSSSHYICIRGRSRKFCRLSVLFEDFLRTATYLTYIVNHRTCIGFIRARMTSSFQCGTIV